MRAADRVDTFFVELSSACGKSYNLRLRCAQKDIVSECQEVIRAQQSAPKHTLWSAVICRLGSAFPWRVGVPFAADTLFDLEVA